MMKKIHAFVLKYSNGYTALISCFIFILFVWIVLPAEAEKSEALGLIGSPDTSLFYSGTQLYEIAHSYGLSGRIFYIHQRMTFDVIWPIVYGLFLLISSTFFYKKSQLSSKSHFLYISVIAVMFDYLENLMTSIVMYRYPSQTVIIAHLAGYMTLLKWLTLSLAFIYLITVILNYIIKLFRNKKTHI